MDNSDQKLYTLNCTTHIEGGIRVNTVTWKVPKFLSLLDGKSCREFRTEKFKENANSDTSFCLKMQFLGEKNDIFEIFFLSSTAVFLKVILSSYIERYDKKSIAVKEYHTVSGNKWQYLATFFKRDKWCNSFVLDDETLYLEFKVFVSSDVKISPTYVPNMQISNDFKNLLMDGMFSDVIIKSSDGEQFKVHKAILASRSPVFKELFEHDTIEKATNCVETALDNEILNEILTYIYTDKSPRADEIPEQLLAAAGHYQLHWLKSLCEDAIHKKLTIENAIETLELADLHSAMELKQMTLNFIKDGQAKLITKTEGWHKINSVALIKTIYEFIMSEESDDQQANLN